VTLEFCRRLLEGGKHGEHTEELTRGLDSRSLKLLIFCPWILKAPSRLIQQKLSVFRTVVEEPLFQGESSAACKTGCQQLSADTPTNSIIALHMTDDGCRSCSKSSTVWPASDLSVPRCLNCDCAVSSYEACRKLFLSP
jgi:hypothetical protein